MFLDSQEEYAKAQVFENSRPKLYLDDLFEKISNFKYSEFTLPSIQDGCENQEFKDRLFQYTCQRLNINPDDLLNEFQNLNDENSQALANLIKNRYNRFQMVIIEFLFELLPFNYLRNIANKIRSGKLGSIKNIYNLINDSEDNEFNIRNQLIEILEIEIQKINNIDNTMLTLSNQIQNREQAKKLNSIRNASISVSKKVIQENLLILNIIEKCPLQNLNDIILDILEDDLISSNLL